MYSETMNLAPDIHEIKCLLHDIISRGAQAKIANVLGVSPANLSQRCHPEHERKPGLVEGLREAWAISAVDQEAYEKLLVYIENLLHSWRDTTKPNERGVSILVGEATELLAALQKARFIESRPIHDQRELLTSVIATLQKALSGLPNEFELRSDSDVARFRKGA